MKLERHLPGTVERFGRYLLLRPLKPGQMGSLSLAFDARRRELVVLKRARDLSPDGLTRFAAETELSTKFDHPGLVRAFDSGQVNGTPYLAFPWIAGRDLESMVERAVKFEEHLELKVALEIVRQLALALDSAHRTPGLDFVHRDISPENVMVGFDGQVRLIDYGLAQSRVGRRVTRVGMAVGTRGFIAPDQVEGPSSRSDLYSLGAVLYFAVTGRPPSADALSSLASSGDLSVPAPVAMVLARALAADSSARFSDAGELAARLQDCAPASGDDVKATMARLFPGEARAVEEEHTQLAKEASASIGKPFLAWWAIVPLVLMSVAIGLRFTKNSPSPKAPSIPPLLTSTIDAAALIENRPIEKPADIHNVPLARTVSIARTTSPPRPSKEVAARLAEADQLAKMGSLARAREIYEQLSLDSAARPFVLVERAEVELGTGEYGQALAHASQSISSNGPTLRALKVRAQAELKLREKSRAASDLRRILQLAPHDDEARRWLQRLAPETP